MSHARSGFLVGGLLAAVLLVGCGPDSGGRELAENQAVESCMLCHNGSKVADYAGPGIQNPHPFPGADDLTCTACHGGNPDGVDKDESHVPPPPQIGDREYQRTNRRAYFNRLTLAGVDKFPDYEVEGKTYTSIDYLQFINPGDLRVVSQGRACGGCHTSHTQLVTGSTLATEAGILSGATYAFGIDNVVPPNAGRFEDTSADYGFRAVTDAEFNAADFGTVASLLEFPVLSVRNSDHPDAIHNNDAYNVENLESSLEADNSVRAGSPLANLLQEQVAFTCGDCHLGSAGANNRYGDFRSSGCTSCHMPYSRSGRSGSRDPNVDKTEPYDVDDIDEPERAHIRSHRIVSAKKTLSNGVEIEGMDDYTCAGCHQGSNRTVMQYWGIRLDQNQDLRRGHQYPANPASWTSTRNDTRLFDPEIRNRTFNGRNFNQYILFEDYDDDGRDDTPPDVHYEAGMGCIDCHGSYDLHGGDVDDPGGGRIASRMEHGVAIQCESCHGGVSAYAQTVAGTTREGELAEFAVDTKGNPLTHVVKEADGNFYLTSRLTGKRHFVVQTLDTVVDSTRLHPFTNEPIYSAKASYSMGRDDGLATTGTGPNQGGEPSGFSHADNMDCASCHASWTNTCMGCHLKGEYTGGNQYSNITGEQIVFREDEAQFIYQSPIFFQLGVNSRNRITQTSPNTKMFFQWEDRNDAESRIYTFSDRNGNGSNTQYPSLGHNAMMAHSIRGKVTETDEGPRYCVACHLTTDGLDQHGDEYLPYRQAVEQNLFGYISFDLLQQHLGRNPGNQMNSPYFVHMVAGLGTGLFLFDEDGAPINPLDDDDNRYGVFDENGNRVSPASLFDPLTMASRVAYNLDRIVRLDGVPTGSNNHALIQPLAAQSLRSDTPNPAMAGPLGMDLIRRLTDPETGIVLTGWLDANGDLQGGAAAIVNPSPSDE